MSGADIADSNSNCVCVRVQSSVGWFGKSFFCVSVYYYGCGEGERLQLLVCCLSKESAPDANALHYPPVAEFAT